MPAEWEPQAAVWLSWPHRRATWPGRFRPIPSAFARVAAAISRYQEVRINAVAALRPQARRLCKAAGANLDRVRFFPHRTNDAWCRDHGPIFVRNDRTGEVAITDWTYNAWGGKYPPFGDDNRIPARIARRLGLRRFPHAMVLEGGSIDVDGQGDLLTSEQCLLNPNRNPDLSREEIEANLRGMLGVQRVLWVGEGIAGDDTDGHIDDIGRFFRPGGIVAAKETNSRDANYRPLRGVWERLESFRTRTGGKFELVALPMPAPVVFDGQRVPASYANFLVINGAVLVPTFRQRRRDAAACAVLGACFPGREIVPIDCADLIWGLGTLHCISQQQPA
ncbi:MAG: agmatine deiminase family protein [Verrucomicrobia bacterium]|nr:agmatine deiminase family protein [Verrucomicrobiota bacterium]